MERKSETTRNHTRVNNLTMISLSRSLMKHVIYINSEKLPGKSRPRSIPSLIKRDTLRRKRDLIWSVTWFPFGLWTLIGYSAIISETNNRKKKGTNFLHVQDARNRFTMFESLFTRIHGLKLRSFVLKILKIVCDLKQNLLLDNTFKTCQHFN